MGELERLQALCDEATPGPWAWFGNTGTHTMHLATTHSGHVFVMDFVRWGMGSAQPRFQVKHRMVPAKDLVTYQVEYRRDIAAVDHPDARFIAASRTALPRLLAVARAAETYLLTEDGPGEELSRQELCDALAALESSDG